MLTLVRLMAWVVAIGLVAVTLSPLEARPVLAPPTLERAGAYALFGFLLTLWTAWCYNGIARRLGGIEWTARVPGPVGAVQPIRTALLDISKLQAAKLMASIPYWAEDSTLAGSTVLLLPLGYTVFGFLFTLVEAWVYNGLAARIGGIEFEVVPVASADGAGIAQA